MRTALWNAVLRRRNRDDLTGSAFVPGRSLTADIGNPVFLVWLVHGGCFYGHRHMRHQFAIGQEVPNCDFESIFIDIFQSRRRGRYWKVEGAPVPILQRPDSRLNATAEFDRKTQL